MAIQVKNGGALAFSGTGLKLAIKKLENFCRISENKEICKLVTTMNLIVEVLTDAEKKQISSAVVRLSLLELKQVMFDAEDLIDELATDAAVQSKGAHTYNILTMAPSMLGQIHKMNSRLDHLEPQITMLDFQIPTLQDRCPGLATWRQTSSLLPDEKSVVGRNKEKEHIIEMLTRFDESSSKDFSIVPIVGLGGMGKTTLAQLVFNDKKVKKHFELMMWVCVSHDFDLVRLTKNIIEAALAFKGMYKQCQLNNWDAVQRRLLQEVEGKTFLLVLDDVWEAKHSMWEDLFKPLRSGKKGSKVLVTSRNMVFVDKLEGRIETPVFLGGLSDTDIWDLFKKCAFRGNVYGDGTISAEFSHLEDLRRHIIQRLKGSPLAARTIGSLLNHELSAQHWKEVLESEFWNLPQKEGDILPALQLSYEYLSTDLKQCFAYCSLFPKGYKFSREVIVQLWEAQSFIRKGRGERMETMGSKYFDELLQMSFFESAPSRFYGNFYVMHDLIHDLAEYVSRNDCFKLEDQNKVKIPDTVHHMSVYVSERGQIDIINKLCFYEKLRTLLFRTSCHLNTRDLDQLFLKLKMLRVLGLNDCGIEELPDSIGDLKHLRYIDLQGNRYLTRVPESLGNLYNLQVLNLHYCYSLRVLPSKMCQLVKLTIEHCPKLKELPTLPRTLRRLKLHGVGIFCLPELDGCSGAEGGIETSTSSLHLPRTSASVLSILDIFSCDNLTSVSRLLQQQLPDLEEIKIVKCKKLMSLPEKGFGHLVSLKRLKIKECPILTRVLQKVGSSQYLPCSLEELDICQCGDVMDGWWWVGVHHHHLPVAFRELVIDGNNLFGRHQVSTPLRTSSSQLSARAIRAFTSLENLTIRHSPNFLKKWGGDDGDDADQELTLEHSLPYLSGLTSLEILHIKHFPSLQSLPDTLSCLSSLRTLEIWHCPSLQSLPDIACLSLQTLRICHCHSIQSWPTNGLPSTLLTLEITRCHALTSRLEEYFNSLWPEVAHIPNVIIDGVHFIKGFRL